MKSRFEIISELTGINASDFNRDGLRHDPEILTYLANRILLFPITEASKYVNKETFVAVCEDSTTKQLQIATNKPINELQNRLGLSSKEHTPQLYQCFPEFTTFIGNASFVAVYHKEHEVRICSNNHLIEIKQALVHGLFAKRGFLNTSCIINRIMGSK